MVVGGLFLVEQKVVHLLLLLLLLLLCLVLRRLASSLMVHYRHLLLRSMDQTIDLQSNSLQKQNKQNPKNKSLYPLRKLRVPGLFNVNCCTPFSLRLFLIISLCALYFLQCRNTCTTDSSSWHPSHKPVWCFPIISVFCLVHNAQALTLLTQFALSCFHYLPYLLWHSSESDIDVSLSPVYPTFLATFGCFFPDHPFNLCFTEINLHFYISFL